MPDVAVQLLAYFGVMVVTFVIPVVTPGIPTLYFAKFAPPWAIALVASAATATAASIDYYLVRRVFRLRSLERVRAHRLFTTFERWAKVAPFPTIVLFAAVPPFPFLLPRVLMPLSGYSVRRYAVAAALGRYPRIFVMAAAGRALEIPNWILLVMLAGGAVIGSVGAIVRYRRNRLAAAAALAPSAAPPAKPPPEDKAA